MIFSLSSLTPTCPGLVQVEGRVTRRASKDSVRQATLSFSLTHVSVLRLSSETSSWPRAQPTTQVSPAVEFVQSSASNFSFWAMVLSVKVAYLSGR